MLWVTTIVTFIVIELPPGDYVSTLVSRLEGTGHTISEETRQQIQKEFGLDKPLHIRYKKWVEQITNGNLGYSFDWKRPVKELIGQRLSLPKTHRSIKHNRHLCNCNSFWGSILLLINILWGLHIYYLGIYWTRNTQFHVGTCIFLLV
ncbi:MAG: hypothetical protein CM1200mP6_02170 [Anaerolineaceae bacterium]|nr:MAG: hypothetical protein CM1200mP6_02170 [Anaerolineaceae bacterium]